MSHETTMLEGRMNMPAFRIAMFATVVAAFILLAGCSAPPQDPAGAYKGEYAHGPELVEVVLSPGGEGQWSVGRQVSEFRWTPGADGVVWLEQKDGSRYSGTVRGPVLAIDLPGYGKHELQKTSPGGGS